MRQIYRHLIRLPVQSDKLQYFHGLFVQDPLLATSGSPLRKYFGKTHSGAQVETSQHIF
jgi:hypothetical protein